MVQPKGFQGEIALIEDEIRALGAAGILFERIAAFLEPKVIARKRFRQSGNAAPDAEAWGIATSEQMGVFSALEQQVSAARVADTHLIAEGETLLSLMPPTADGGAFFGIWFPMLAGRVASLPPSAVGADELAPLVVQSGAFCVAGGADTAAVLGASFGESSASAAPAAFACIDPISPDRESDLRESLAECGTAFCPAWIPDGCVGPVSLSQPHAEGDEAQGRETQAGWREGSPGRLLPGFTFCGEGEAATIVERDPDEVPTEIPAPGFTRDEDGFLIPPDPKAK
jgi:hypothetical protein